MLFSLGSAHGLGRAPRWWAAAAATEAVDAAGDRPLSATRSATSFSMGSPLRGRPRAPVLALTCWRSCSLPSWPAGADPPCARGHPVFGAGAVDAAAHPRQPAVLVSRPPPSAKAILLVAAFPVEQLGSRSHLSPFQRRVPARRSSVLHRAAISKFSPDAALMLAALSRR